MRLTAFISGLYLATTVVNGLIVPPNGHAHVVRDAAPEPVAALDDDAFASVKHLVPRKGGGGRGGGGSSGSSGGGRSSGSSSSSSSGRGASTSNAGGRTTTGSGVRPAYGGYYGGGGSVPYTAGGRSGLGFLPLGLFAVGATALIFPGLWLYGAYYYPWSHPHSFYNASAQQNQTKPVLCLCQEYSVCGCDENTNSTYMTSVIGDGDFAKLNRSLAYVNDVNGTSTIILNGTLPNGTTADGGSEDANGVISGASASIPRNVLTTLFSMSVFWALWMM